MNYFIMALPPVAAIIIFLIALKNGIHKQALIVTVGITMVVTMFTMKYLSWYGVICIGAGALALIYVVICLVLSIVERRDDKEGDR